MKLGHQERLGLISACRLADLIPYIRARGLHRKALYESMPSWLRAVTMTKEVKAFTYSGEGVVP